MFFQDIQIFKKHGKQFIKDLSNVVLPETFTGRPEIIKEPEGETALFLQNLCPTKAIDINPFSINIGKCVFCKECQFRCPENIVFTNDFRMAVNCPEDLIVTYGVHKLEVTREIMRPEIKSFFKKTLKLRQVSAGGDNSAELELNAAGNVNFDMGRFGIEFVASPRHADGIVITGPISGNMAEALQKTFDAIPSPKLVILAGTDAISGGIFAESNSINRKFLSANTIDLYLPGNPPHPLTIINGLLYFINLKPLPKY
ncbi:MAG: NADH:ubiquinone oxidoreductase [Bacteroidetes bacterium GWE2_29_8]|nr:MAG: NADH:ubiquinone oxidoreductase [Bacteroidetes bacterium GWE2_29_8]OFY21216.1 MAG: NADH:ubiquinone oxidoreductase [Bacteroidetes bacterium GWF2_29_10]